ncbi:hypothetical protein HDU76_004551 [Blyttiomyces sp. JEL0837]|nr:hypothetical protein HDU76_004551 [Blyttiomyces sp. JEL0837]
MQIINTLLVTLASMTMMVAAHEPTLEFKNSLAQIQSFESAACVSDAKAFLMDMNGCVPGFYNPATGQVNQNLPPLTADQKSCICKSNVPNDVNGIVKDCTDPQLVSDAKDLLNTLNSVCPSSSSKSGAFANSASMGACAAAAVFAVAML